MSDFLVSLFTLLFAAIAWILLIVGVPASMYFMIRMAYHKRAELGRTWHDLYGLNRINLIFFPTMLDEEGSRYRDSAIGWLRYVAIGVACGLIAFYFEGLSSP